MGHGSHKKKPGQCITACEWPVGVDVTVDPHVSCQQMHKECTEFEFEVNFDVRPHCRPYCKEVCKDKCGCVTSCTFGVEVDFDCDAHVKCRPCKKAAAEFLICAEIEANPNCCPKDKCKPPKPCHPCRPPKPCRPCDDSSSSCSCDDCRRC